MGGTGAGQPAAVVLPTSIGAAVRAEFARAFHSPFETPIVVAVNGALMSSCWFLLPGTLTDAIFTLHGPLAFALVLATWMYSDVPATNVLGPDRERVTAAIDEPRVLRRLLYAKNLVVWLFITPLCSVIAVVIGLAVGDLTAAAFSVLWIVVVPLGALGISAWVGIVFPYHPIPVRARWQHRRPWWQKIGRWLALALTPYGLVPLVSVLLMAPSLLLWGLTSPDGLGGRLPDHDLGLGVVVACAVALLASSGGHRVGVRIARRRRTRLLAYLADPGRG